MDVEHLEPVQSLTLSRRSRARTIIATMVPPLLLIVVIGAGILGGGGVDNAPPETARRAEVPAESPVEASPAPDLEGLRAAGFPTRALGLPVRSVAGTNERRVAGELRGKVVAVAGWLTVPPDPSCGIDAVDTRDDLYRTGSDCRRWTLLTDDANPAFAIRAGSVTAMRDVASALWPQALPGPSLASIAAAQVASDRVLRPARAIVLGRFGDPRLSECRDSRISCATTFAIERVVWVDGDWRLRRPEIMPADVEPDPSGIIRWPILDSAIQRGSIVLSEVIASREDLASLDPAADAATPRDAATIWYVRALLRPRGLDDPIGQVGWAVIDDDSGVVLAADPEPEPEQSRRARPTPTPPTADDVVIPARMFGLEVLDVAKAHDVGQNDLDPERLIMVDGWLTVAPDQPGCTELPSIACPRRGSLSGAREPSGPTIGVETLPGTPLLGLTRQSPSLGTWTVPNRVALVGRLRQQASTCPPGSSCELVLTVERLAWLRTAARERPVLTAPGTLESNWSREAAEATLRDAIEGVGATLLLALVDRPTLERLDPAAARALSGSADTGPVWYLRSIAWEPGPGTGGVPVVAWSVADDRTHATIASGRWRGPS